MDKIALQKLHFLSENSDKVKFVTGNLQTESHDAKKCLAHLRIFEKYLRYPKYTFDIKKLFVSYLTRKR